jgi:hypothetical protein
MTDFWHIFVDIKVKQIYKKMTISQETIENWKSLKEEGDIPKLATLLGVSAETIYRIFKNGQTTVERASKINKFYADRKKKADKITLDDLN